MQGRGRAGAVQEQGRGRAGAVQERGRGRAGAGPGQVSSRAGAEPGQDRGRVGVGPGQCRGRAWAVQVQGQGRAGAEPRQDAEPGQGRGRAGAGQVQGLGQVQVQGRGRCKAGAGAGAGPGAGQGQGRGRAGAGPRQVLQRFGFTYSSPQSTPLPTGHSLSAPPSDESVEPSGPYPELVGRLITLGMGLVLGGRARVVLTGHAGASWVDDLTTQQSSQGYTFSLGSGSVSWRSTRSSSVLSSSCEAEIYAGAMAAQELRWLTYLLTDLGEAPRSPPVLYQRGQLRLTYVASRANTADVFTKALQPCDHQCFCTVLGPLALRSDRTRAASPTVSHLLATAVTGPSFESAAAYALVAELLDFAAACRLDYATALVAESAFASPPSVGVAITGPYSSQWQAATDAEMASWKSTGTYVDEVPLPGANIVDGMWIFRVKRPPGSPLAFKARYIARGFSQRQGVDYFQTFSPTPKMTTLRVLLHVAAQRDYELHSLDFSTAFLQGSLHEEIWLRRPHGFIGLFPAGTQWSICRPVYSLRPTPREWHDTLRTTLAALGFAPSTTDPSLFLWTDTSLPPFYVLVYVDDLVFAIANTEALTLVNSELQKRHTCTDLGELHSYLGLQITRDRARRTITLTQSHMVHQVLQRFGFQFSSPQPTPLSTSHSLSAPPSDESVEPSGLYPELVGCLMYLMTCTRPDLAYPLSLLDRYMAPVRRAWGSCLEDGVQLYSLVTQTLLGSSCEAEIYAGAMAAQELRWLTHLLTDLGEQPRSPPVLYVDNKAMIALCQEHRLEHRTKHIADIV
ncbi:unnamed protein product [Closterium sp. NIES-53]